MIVERNQVVVSGCPDGQPIIFTHDFGCDQQAARPALILHCRNDALVPMPVADWMSERMPDATLKVLDATGHAPHMTVPLDVVAAMREYLGDG